MTVNALSSHGVFSFDTETGLVTDTVGLDTSFGARPLWVDVNEWKRRYPGETIDGDTDVLDLAYMGADGVYCEAAEEWRKDREAGVGPGDRGFACPACGGTDIRKEDTKTSYWRDGTWQESMGDEEFSCCDCDETGDEEHFKKETP